MASSDERRSEFRKATSKRGLILGPGMELACTITDVSTDGCRIRLDRPFTLPAQVVLVDIEAGVGCEAQVMWSRLGETGLKITARSGLTGLTPTRFMAARAAWLRHARR